jgi:TetR/AcrR family transcriptional regulator, regulator of cefoperazone and chloramphenicol sensitivity
MNGRTAEMRLIEVGIDQFGQAGMSAVGTRAIAEAAGLQMSAITYHFGGKEGLYRACAEHIAAQMGERLAPVLARAGTDPGDAAGARSAILALLGGLVSVMMQDEVAPIARFVVREQMSPTPAFDILYDRAMRRVIDPMVVLLNRVAGGRLTPEELRVRSLALLGQVFAFRFARAALMRTTGWESVGAVETEAVRAAVLAHSDAILRSLEAGMAPAEMAAAEVRS